METIFKAVCVGVSFSFLGIRIGAGLLARAYPRAGRKKAKRLFDDLDSWFRMMTMMAAMIRARRGSISIFIPGLSHITFASNRSISLTLEFPVQRSRFPISTSFFFFLHFFDSRVSFYLAMLLARVFIHGVSAHRICFISQLTLVIVWEMCRHSRCISEPR